MLKDYFAKSEYIDGIGEIYPVNVIEYEEFSKLAQLYIAVDKRALEIELDKDLKDVSTLEIILSQIKAFEIANDENLLNLLKDEEAETFKSLNNVSYKLNIEDFIKTLKIVLHKDVIFDEENVRFVIIDEENMLEEREINIQNFDSFKEIVMRQNLLFTPLYYEDPILQGILTNLRKNKKEENNNGFDLEAICQILSIEKGINPKEFIDYTYYQLIAEYTRLQIIDNYNTARRIQTSGFASENLVIPKISEKVNLNKHPESTMIEFNSDIYDKGDKL